MPLKSEDMTKVAVQHIVNNIMWRAVSFVGDSMLSSGGVLTGSGRTGSVNRIVRINTSNRNFKNPYFPPESNPDSFYYSLFSDTFVLHSTYTRDSRLLEIRANAMPFKGEQNS